MASKNDILTQATLEYEAAKRKGDKAGMVSAHAKADRARGAYTKTVVKNGRYVQQQLGTMGADAASGKLLEQTRQLNAPVLPKATPQLTRNATGQTSSHDNMSQGFSLHVLPLLLLSL